MTVATVPRLADELLLDAWELGLHSTPVERAAQLHRLGEASRPEPREPRPPRSLTVGMLDAGLLDCREAAFGTVLEAVVDCPACDEPLEFTIDVADLRAPSAAPGVQRVTTSTRPAYAVTVRRPTLADVEAASHAQTVDEARWILVERCVTRVTCEGARVDVHNLPGSALVEVGSAMAAGDPQADLRLALNCPACGHAWESRLDLPGYLWGEIDARAHQLLADVHILAGWYGWREHEILELGAARRQAYLDLVLG